MHVDSYTSAIFFADFGGTRPNFVLHTCCLVRRFLLVSWREKLLLKVYWKFYNYLQRNGNTQIAILWTSSVKSANQHDRVERLPLLDIGGRVLRAASVDAVRRFSRRGLPLRIQSTRFASLALTQCGCLLNSVKQHRGPPAQVWSLQRGAVELQRLTCVVLFWSGRRRRSELGLQAVCVRVSFSKPLGVLSLQVAFCETLLLCSSYVHGLARPCNTCFQICAVQGDNQPNRESWS